MSSVEMSAVIGAMIVHSAAALGVSTSELQRATGFDVALAADPDARIPLALETALWNEAARLARDAVFGLHAAEHIRPGAFDVLDYAVRTAPTLRASLERLARYNRLVHDAAVFTLVPKGEVLRVEHAFRTLGAEQCRHSAEFTIASLVTVGTQVGGAPLPVRAVEFRHGRPQSDAACEALHTFFGVEPRFAQSVNAIEFPQSVLDRELPHADAALSRVIERNAEALLAALPEVAESTGDRVRRMLASALGEGDASLSALARRLRMSERTLQRKLADEGLSYDALLDSMRRDLALRYLADRSIAVGEVAYLLGYSEPSPFHRAFKRWTGLTPSEARKRAA